MTSTFLLFVLLFEVTFYLFGFLLVFEIELSLMC